MEKISVGKTFSFTVQKRGEFMKPKIEFKILYRENCIKIMHRFRALNFPTVTEKGQY
jgi:hypothetical protein